ncbi:MAG: YbbR-like domain-containing protein, partial [Proteobacteria bacterium]
MKSLLKSIFNLFFNNFGYKLLAILLAVVVWAIIQGEQIQEVNREILVEIHVSPEYGVRGDLLRIKAATIRGPQAWLLEVPKRLTAEVFVPPGKVGEHRVRLSKDDVKNLNERLELIIHEPNLILYVDKVMERSVPIKETIHGAPADGYTVERVNIEPKNIVVKGIRKDILDLRTIFTEPVDVTGLRENKVVESRLISPGLGSLSIATNPVLITLINTFILRKPVKRKVIYSLILCAAGVLLAAWPLFITAHATPGGLAMLMGSMLLYSFGVIYFSEHKWNDLHILTINGWQTLL